MTSEMFSEAIRGHNPLKLFSVIFMLQVFYFLKKRRGGGGDGGIPRCSDDVIRGMENEVYVAI